MTKSYVLALDQGTTSSRAMLLFDHDGKCVGAAQQEFTQHYPQAGWVEHDPLEIWKRKSAWRAEFLPRRESLPTSWRRSASPTSAKRPSSGTRSAARPIHPAIVWQCRRTAAICDELKARGLEPYIRETTGLVVDAYFSATKIKRILDHVAGARERASNGELLFGTVDSWLIWKLSGGKLHVTDYSNASRTMLFNIRELCWDPRLLAEPDIPAAMLPQVKPSSCVYGDTDLAGFSGRDDPHCRRRR